MRSSVSLLATLCAASRRAAIAGVEEFMEDVSKARGDGGDMYAPHTSTKRTAGRLPKPNDFVREKLPHSAI